jgi:hypothetical protein
MWPYELLDRIPFAMSSVLPKPVPYTAELPTVTLLSHFTPKLADVAAALEQAFVKIAGIDVDRVWVSARRPFRKRAGLYPSLHGAKADIELASNVGLTHTPIDQGSHLFIEAVPALAILLFRRESRRGRNLNCCERLSRVKSLAGFGRLRHDLAMGFESGSQCLTQVVQKMPAIGDLDGLWSSPPCGLGIDAGPIATDDLRSRMLSQPCSNRL